MNAYVYAKGTEVSRALWLGALIVPMGCSPAEVDPVQLASGGAGGASASCGDGTCAADESAQSCPADCGGSGGGGGAGGGGVGGGGGGVGGGAGGGVVNEAPIFLAVGNAYSVPIRWAYYRSNRQSEPSKRGNIVELGEHCFLVDWRIEGHDEGMSTAPSPGLVTISAGTTIGGGESGEFTLDPSGDGEDFHSPGPQTTNALWAVGSVVTASAPGDTGPGFEVQITIPTTVELTFPDVLNAAADEIHINRASDYVLTWTPTDGTVEVEIEQSPASDGWDLLDLICLFPGTAGTGTLPVEGLSEFNADVEDEEILSTIWVAHDDITETTLGGRPFLYWGSQSIVQAIVLD